MCSDKETIKNNRMNRASSVSSIYDVRTTYNSNIIDSLFLLIIIEYCICIHKNSLYNYIFIDFSLLLITKFSLHNYLQNYRNLTHLNLKIINLYV